jgi:3-hydroxyphenylacetate 6-hydroxylase
MLGLAIWVRAAFISARITRYTFAKISLDAEVWEEPEVFRPERWIEQPDAPLHTYGLGYRMCAGSLLANRELYLVFIRMIHAFKIQKFDDVDCHPVRGNSDPTSLVSMPGRYRAKFVPRNKRALKKAMKEFKVVEMGG